METVGYRCTWRVDLFYRCRIEEDPPTSVGFDKSSTKVNAWHIWYQTYNPLPIDPSVTSRYVFGGGHGRAGPQGPFVHAYNHQHIQHARSDQSCVYCVTGDSLLPVSADAFNLPWQCLACLDAEYLLLLGAAFIRTSVYNSS